MSQWVRRCPIIVAPHWAQTLSQPIALQDVTASIRSCIDNKAVLNRSYDLVGPEVVSFSEMMEELAEQLKIKRSFIDIPFNFSKLSTWWLRMIARIPKRATKPLIMGLAQDLISNEKSQFEIRGQRFLTMEEMLQESIKAGNGKNDDFYFRRSPKALYEVRSVQRLPLPQGWNAADIARAYMDFLPKAHIGLMSVEVHGKWIYFSWVWPKTKMLILEYSQDRSWPFRQLFYVRGGLLSKKTHRGRLEFREVLSGEAAIAAIHEFKPRLPWYVYRWSQALVHLLVMKKFGKYLRNQMHKPSDKSNLQQSLPITKTNHQREHENDSRT
jgi:hypothetical protein